MAARTADKVIKVALSQVGYMEKRSNKDLKSKTKNKGYANYTIYNAVMKKVRHAGTLRDFWCDNFVSWCFYTAYGKKDGKNLLYGYSNYVPYTVAHFKAHKRYFKKGKRAPKAGDLIIFQNQGHIGLVVKVTKSYVYTVEGNTSGSGYASNGGMVAHKRYSRKYYRIEGYCRPKYDKKVVKKVTTKAGTQKTTVKVEKAPVKKNLSTKKKQVKEKLKKFPVIKLNSKGAYVKKLQNRLNKQLKINLALDGIAGKKTIAYLKKFQKLKGLKVTGTTNYATWKALYNV